MLKLIRRIVQDVSAAEGLGEALAIIVTRVKLAMATDVCSVYLTDHVRKRHVLRATDGLLSQSVGLSLDYEEGVVGMVAAREELINLKDAAVHPNFRYLPETGEERFHAFLGVPIIHARKLLGILIVQQKTKRRFSSNQEAFLVTISAQLAGVIAHAEVTGSVAHLAYAEELQVAPRPTLIKGIASASGIAMGTGFVVYPLTELDEIPDRMIKNIPAEIRRFQRASRKAVSEIRQLGKRLKSHLPPEEQALFEAYEQILSSDSIGDEVIEEIKTGCWAQGALKKVIQKHIRIFESMEDEYLRERSTDLKDLSLRVLTHLQKIKTTQILYPEKVILVGEEVSAPQLAEIPRKQLAGVISKKGSRNSHIAILARAMDIPLIMGFEDLSVSHLDGQPLIVDGYSGELHITPSDRMQKKYLGLIEQERELKTDLAQLAKLPATTKDGHITPLYVNTGLSADINVSLQGGAEGVGLYRTEIPFMIGDQFPSEKAQEDIYRQWLEAFSPKPVVMRTLDIGGDKPLPYFPVEEDNPFLGWRGIRISLDHPEIFLIQVRAMLKASVALGNLSILLPMISRLEEVDEALALLHRAYEELCQEGEKISKPLIGVMLEVPSAIYQAQKIAKRVDFLSVGSNDLTQYLLAVDRNNARVAGAYDGLHPSVLQALDYAVKAAHKAGKPISICGEMAGDPLSVLLLVAMGFDALSMNASSLSKVKYVLKHFTLKEAKTLLFRALRSDKVAEVRNQLLRALKQKGLEEMALRS